MTTENKETTTATETQKTATEETSSKPAATAETKATEQKVTESSETKKQEEGKEDKSQSKADGSKEKSILDKAGEKEAEKKPDEKAEGEKQVPEKYEFKLPEGMSVDQTTLAEFEPLAKEAKLSQEEAQKFVDIYVAKLKAVSEAQEQAYKETLEAWKKETMTELGAKANEELTFAAKTRDTFFSPATRELLNATGLSNNIHFIRDCIKLGKQISEEKLVEGDRKGGKEVTAKDLYPSMQQK